MSICEFSTDPLTGARELPFLSAMKKKKKRCGQLALSERIITTTVHAERSGDPSRDMVGKFEYLNAPGSTATKVIKVEVAVWW